jgi:hypothetical protein
MYVVIWSFPTIGTSWGKNIPYDFPKIASRTRAIPICLLKCVSANFRSFVRFVHLFVLSCLLLFELSLSSWMLRTSIQMFNQMNNPPQMQPQVLSRRAWKVLVVPSGHKWNKPKWRMEKKVEAIAGVRKSMAERNIISHEKLAIANRKEERKERESEERFALKQTKLKPNSCRMNRQWTTSGWCLRWWQQKWKMERWRILDCLVFCVSDVRVRYKKCWYWCLFVFGEFLFLVYNCVNISGSSQGILGCQGKWETKDDSSKFVAPNVYGTCGAQCF